MANFETREAAGRRTRVRPMTVLGDWDEARLKRRAHTGTRQFFMGWSGAVAESGGALKVPGRGDSRCHRSKASSADRCSVVSVLTGMLSGDLTGPTERLLFIAASAHLYRHGRDAQ